MASKLFISAVVSTLILFLCAERIFGAAGTPHVVYGKVLSSTGTSPNQGGLKVHFYIPARPEEILDGSSDGCGYGLFSGLGWLWSEVGNCATPWAINDNLRIIVIDNSSGQTGATDLALNGSGNQALADVVLSAGDHVGPIAYDAMADGARPASVPQGRASITLTATIEDSLCGNSKIQKAEYFIDSDPGKGLGTPMDPQNHSFNSPKEDAVASVNTSSWKQGTNHTIYVRGEDAAGNWGAAHMIVVNVTKPIQVRGDINGDSVVDQKDLNIILGNLNKPADVCPLCDLDGDGKITALDSRILVTLCKNPQCK